MVLSKVRQWATQVPEIRVETEGRNPLISVQLSDVDYESVVDRARGEDNDGRRRELIKRLVAEGFGLDALGPQDMLGAHTHKVIWRGTAREVDLVFGNVRDAGWLTDEHFRARPSRGEFVIDHPFDDPGHSASEDLARIDQMRARNWDERTIVWLPRFFSSERMRDVSRLVILNYLLEGSGDRYASYADHLSETGPGAGEGHPAVAAGGAAAPGPPGHPGGLRRRVPAGQRRRGGRRLAPRGAGLADAQLHAPTAGRRHPQAGVRVLGAGGVLRHLPGAPAVRAGRRRGAPARAAGGVLVRRAGAGRPRRTGCRWARTPRPSAGSRTRSGSARPPRPTS